MGQSGDYHLSGTTSFSERARATVVAGPLLELFS